jgi:endonuclease YncB( thermonuclease family)
MKVQKNAITLSLTLLIGLISFQVNANTCEARSNHQRVRNSLGSKCDHKNDRFNCLDVLEVTDGDTISVNITGVHPYFAEDTSIRLYGLDTPESKPASVKCIKPDSADAEIDKDEYEVCKEALRLRKCEITASDEATKILNEAICSNSDRIDVELAKDSNGKLIREKYGRVLGSIIIVKYNGSRASTTNAQELLLKESLAFPYGGGTKTTRDWCSKKVVRAANLQTSYVRENFCSSRKCTEKTYQKRCFHRGSYNAQVDCYQDRIDDNIGRWFASCSRKKGKERRDCFTEKSENYYEFCRQYDTSKDVKACKTDIAKTMERYCKSRSSNVEEDCLSVL